MGSHGKEDCFRIQEGGEGMKKTIVYCAAPVVVTGIVEAVLLLLHIDPIYAVCYGILAAVASWVITSSVWHTVMGTWSVKIVCSKVWLAIAVGLWAWAINISGWDLFTAVIGLMVACIGHWAGFRWISGDDSKVFSEAKVQKLAETMLFKLDMDGNADHAQPLCMIKGSPVTPAVAREMGQVEMADAAIDYIRTIV